MLERVCVGVRVRAYMRVHVRECMAWHQAGGVGNQASRVLGGVDASVYITFSNAVRVPAYNVLLVDAACLLLLQAPTRGIETRRATLC